MHVTVPVPLYESKLKYYTRPSSVAIRRTDLWRNFESVLNHMSFHREVVQLTVGVAEDEMLRGYQLLRGVQPFQLARLALHFRFQSLLNRTLPPFQRPRIVQR